MFFVITTNSETAQKIENQCAFDAKHSNRSYELGEVEYNEGYVKIQIKAKNGKKIKAEDIFWLGFFSSTQYNKPYDDAERAQ